MSDYTDKDTLRRLYLVEDLSQTEIAERFGVTQSAVWTYLDRYGIEKGAECPTCGSRYVSLGQHWEAQDHYPEISFEDKQLLRGLLMGDASVGRSSSNSHCLYLSMINKEFLFWLYEDRIDYLCQTPPTIKTDAESSREETMEYFPNQNTSSSDNYSDVYRLRTVYHRWFSELRSWYSGGEKEFPEDLAVTPELLKMWYVTDGSYTDGYVNFGSKNESDRPEFLISLLEQVGLDATYSSPVLHVRAHSTSDFFDFVGDPVPGFEHKWP